MIPPGLELEQDSFMSEEEPTARPRNNSSHHLHPPIWSSSTSHQQATPTVELTNLNGRNEKEAQPADALRTVPAAAVAAVAAVRETNADDPALAVQPAEPVLVETVVSDEDGSSIMKKQQQQQEQTAIDDNNHKQNEDLQMVLDIFPQNTQSAIRCTLTLLAACLVPAAFLTLLGAMRSHTATGFLFLAVVWAVLLVLFAALVWFVQKVMLEQDRTTNAQVFHPYIHAVADMIVQEYRDFREDCKYEYLLMLEDGPAATEENEYVRMGDNENAASAADEQQKRRGRKPKSAIFRNIVKPIVRPFARRRKRKLQKQQEAVAAAENYVPPPEL